VRYLAKLSTYGARSGMNFWNQWDATAHWLQSIGRSTDHSELWVRAKGLSPLSPWLQDSGARVANLTGWMDSTSVASLWKYLRIFAQGRIESFKIPCGNEAWVEYSPDRMIRIKAAEASWLWREATEVWHPEAWPDLRQRAWRDHGRTQQAWRYSWGYAVARHVRSGWKEWTVRADEDYGQWLDQRWSEFVDRLGLRPVHLSWSPAEGLVGFPSVGLPARVDEVSLRIAPMLAVRPDFRQRSLAGLSLEALWQFPVWGPNWSARIALLKAGLPHPRLEARFDPVSEEDDDHFLRVQAHRLPILGLSALPFPETVQNGSWDEVSQWIDWHSDAQALVQACRDFAHHLAAPAGRLPEGWRYSRLESEPGRWVIRHCRRPISIELSWPRAVHPGHISLSIGGVVNVDLDELDPSGLVNRWDPRWQYWQTTVNRLLIRVGDWIESDQVVR